MKTLIGSSLAAFGAALLIAGMLAVPGTAAAQDGDPELGKRLWLTTANCKDCHGSLANGAPDIAQEPQGYNLRETILTAEEMRDTVRCGRIGGLMPYFQSSAWTDRAPCYGMIAADIGNDIPDRAERMLADRTLNALIAFIYRDFVGVALNLASCTELLGEENSRCNAFR
ncbi:MAG: hypothetical protein HOB82_08165 [Alphaproteobacteria bacterium]|jgi:hypothetical protein|nr:hypothetical protein [Alphaproteobacteria bacterium]MBT5860171.1 hypothetical protein [Alphaproteobacteria bacterium]